MKKSMLITRILIAVVLLSLVFLFVLHAQIRLSPDMGLHGACVSVSFDKMDMLSADKLVIQANGKQITVTDPETVRAFAWDTLAATSTEDYCCANLCSGWFELYRGDRLIRRMRYIDNHSTLVYEADATHWVLFGKEGHAQLSPDVSKQIDSLLRPQ